MKTFDSCRVRVVGIGALIWLLTCPPSVQGQALTPLHRVRTARLDSAVIGRVTTFFEAADRRHATELATLLDSAAHYFQKEFGDSFALYLAVLRPNTWFDPYQEGAPALYGMPWGWVPESLITVPASLTEGILIGGPDEEADLRRVRFVMLHEYGHLAAKAYLHPHGEQLWSSVHWFEEMVATYFAYGFVYWADPAWAQAGRREWVAYVQRDPPRSATLDWRFMASLSPQQFGQVYAWYQNLLNVRAADLYAEHGLDFLRDVRDELPWTNSDEWTTDLLLTHLESFAPGFQAWAKQLQQGRYVSRQRR